MLSRRTFGMTAAATAALSGAGLMRWFGQKAQAEEDAAQFEISYPDEEWRRRLTPEQYYVLREHGTERGGSGPLDRVKRAGAVV